MDTNGDLAIMSHVGHLRRTPELVTGKWIEKKNLVIFQFHKMSQMSQQMSHLRHSREENGLCIIKHSG